MAILARVNAALGQGFEAEAAGLSAKEMVARKHLQREGSTLVSPRFQVIVADLDILQATKSRNWALKRGSV